MESVNNTKEDVLAMIKPIKSSENGIIEFIYAVRRALAFAESKNDRNLVIEKVVEGLSTRIGSLDVQYSSWDDLKTVLYFLFGIDETLEELKSRLSNIRMESKTLKMYYKEIRSLVKDIQIMEYDKRQWHEMFAVLLEVEVFAIKAFIDGMATDDATYLKEMQPKTLRDAYELIKARHEYVETPQTPMLSQKNFEFLCPTLSLKTSLSPNRTFLFHIWQYCPVNFIKITSLPLGTYFTHYDTTIRTDFGGIKVLGRIYISLHLGTTVLVPMLFYVLPVTSDIDDDGVVQLNFGTVEKTSTGYLFRYRIVNDGVQELKMGETCPKRGECKHWPVKSYFGPFIDEF